MDINGHDDESLWRLCYTVCSSYCAADCRATVMYCRDSTVCIEEM